jgi:hypothetical protein
MSKRIKIPKDKSYSDTSSDNNISPIKIPKTSLFVQNKTNADTQSNEKEPVNKNQDSSFILKKTKKTGNFLIMKKSLKPGVIERVRYVAYGAYLPFGREEYNDNLILNAIIDNSTNYNHNLITTLKRIIDTFESLKTTEQGRYKYGIQDKKIYNYMKELPIDPKIPNIKKYQIRLYLRYGVKATHIKHVGEISYDELKGKKCNLDLELGSMWVSNETMMYGINIHVTHITVIN